MSPATASHPRGRVGVPAPANRRRLRRGVVWLLLTLAGTLVTWWQVGALPHPGQARVGVDFTIYWTSGAHLHHGLDPYQPVHGPLGFVYPPFALLPFDLLSRLTLRTAFLLWQGLDAGILAALPVLAACRSPRTPWWLLPAWLVLLLDGYTVRCTLLGQVGLLLLALVVADIVLLGERRGAGVLTGIAVGIKFTPAVFLVWFVARRQWRPAAMALGGFVLTVLVGLLLAPQASRHYWHELVVQHRLGTGVPGQFGTANNQSLTNAVVLLGGTHAGQLSGAHPLARTMALVATLAGLAGGVLVARTGRRWLTVSVLGAVSCLATSSTWDHHHVWVLAGVLALCLGELRQLPVSGATLMAWIAWSCTGRWHALVLVPRTRFSAAQITEAVATPALATLFTLAIAVELALRGRRPALLSPDAGFSRN